MACTADVSFGSAKARSKVTGALDVVSEGLTGLSGCLDGEWLVAIATVEAAVPMEVDPPSRASSSWGIRVKK